MADKEWSDPNKVGGKYMAGVLADFAPALKEIAKLGSMNNKPNGKYARGSWKLVENPEVEYNDAFWRHLLEGPHEIDPDTSMPHDVAIAWNALALVCFRLMREANEPLKKPEPSYICCDLCGYALDRLGRCLTTACKNYARQKPDWEEICPFCKHPMVLGICSNTSCEER